MYKVVYNKELPQEIYRSIMGEYEQGENEFDFYNFISDYESDKYSILKLLSQKIYSLHKRGDLQQRIVIYNVEENIVDMIIENSSYAKDDSEFWGERLIFRYNI